MELTSVKTAVKERLDAVDEFSKSLPEMKMNLTRTQIKNTDLMSEEWIKWCNLQGELNQMIYSVEWLVNELKIAMSTLGNNLEIEINQKNMLRKSVDLLELKIKPLRNLIMPIQNFVYFCQRESR